MRTVLVILDGLADEPAAALGGRTPLEAAHTPNLDRLAAAGRTGRFDPTPPGARPGSEVGVPACLGMEAGPRRPARARLEALGRGIAVEPAEAVFRATRVRLSGPIDHADTRLLAVADPDPHEAAVAALVPILAARGVRLHPDPRGRHLVVVPGVPDRETVPPQDLTGLPVAAAGPLPRPDLWAWIQERLPDGYALWPWGAGGILPEPAEVPFGALVTGVDLVRGIGRALGLACPPVPGATGGEDTDLAAKARAALKALAEAPRVAVHVEAPDMAAHRRDPRAKAAVLERIDRDLIGPLVAAGLRLAVTADHGTSSRTGRHLEGPVPFLLAEPGANSEGPGRFDERAVADCPALGPAAWRDLFAEVGAPC